MSDLILYGYWRSSCSYRVRIVLGLKNLAYETRPVHLVRDGGRQHTEDYRKLNPMGQVPYLVHQGRGLAQSMAIIDYLEAIHPEPRMFPTDPYDAACVRELCELINTGVQPLQNLAVLQDLGQRFGLDQTGKRAWSRHWLAKGFAAFEKRLEQTSGLFCFGDTPTAADAFLIPQIYNARRFEMDLDRYPFISRIDKTCADVPAFVRESPSAQPDAS